MTSSVLWRCILCNVAFHAALGVSVLAGASDIAHGVEPASKAEILQQLRSFANTGRVLYVAAHPDDENTQVIAYLARGRGYRTAYLSLTRGDGGQNLLGPQLGEALGVARTQELLAARRVDGGRQYFTRAKDFGYSKNAEETLSVWDRQEVLAHAWAPHRVRRARRGGVPARGRPHGVSRAASGAQAVASAAHRAQRRRGCRRGESAGRRGHRGFAGEPAGRSGRGEARGRRS